MGRGKGLPLLVLIAGLVALCACARPLAEEGHFRSERFHLEVGLPPGWAAAEGPTSLARPYMGWVAFNSWGEDGFWASEVVTETDQEVHASYRPEDVLGQLPPDGAYVVLSRFARGPQSVQGHGPEHKGQGLADLWTMSDCREGDTHVGATVVPFFRWGRGLRLEVYCAADATDATAAQVNDLLDTWRFDEVPAGDFGWASLEARQQLPASVQPDRFPLLADGPGPSSSQREDTIWTTSGGYLEALATPGTQIPEATVIVTFTYRWDAPLGGTLPLDCPPDRCHWWRFEARPDGDIVFIDQGSGGEWPTAAIPTPACPSHPSATPTARPLSLAAQKEAFAATEAALADHHRDEDPRRVVEALSEDSAAWLSAGHSPETLRSALYLVHTGWRRQIRVDSIDLNGDGLPDVVVEPQVPGVPVLACLAQEEEDYVCRTVPELTIPGPVMGISHSESLVSDDLTGDGRPETVITYYVPGASGWTELIYIFSWVERTSPDVVFRAALVNWAGPSTWQFESDPAVPGRQQIVLTYPHLHTHGFEHKMVNHPIGRQVWRWDGNLERFVLADKTLDLSESGWGREMAVTTEDQLRWLTNEGETAFRAGLYEEALSAYDEALALAQAEDWTPAADEPDWVGLLRLRRGETLAHLGQATEAVTALEGVASDYEGDLLGDLAATFLAAYGDGSAPDAAEKGCTALQQLRDRVEDHFYYERQGALRFPMTATGILICEPDPAAVASPDETPWPCVGAFGCPPA